MKTYLHIQTYSPLPFFLLAPLLYFSLISTRFFMISSLLPLQPPHFLYTFIFGLKYLSSLHLPGVENQLLQEDSLSPPSVRLGGEKSLLKNKYKCASMSQVPSDLVLQILQILLSGPVAYCAPVTLTIICSQFLLLPHYDFFQGRHNVSNLSLYHHYTLQQNSFYYKSGLSF